VIPVLLLAAGALVLLRRGGAPPPHTGAPLSSNGNSPGRPIGSGLHPGTATGVRPSPVVLSTATFEEAGVDVGTDDGNAFTNRAGLAGGSTVKQSALDYANAHPVIMATNTNGYSAGADLGLIQQVVKQVPGVGPLAAGAIGALNTGLNALGKLTGSGTTNVALDKVINSNAHGIVQDSRPASSSLVSTRDNF
jgi:hypothetical protein